MTVTEVNLHPQQTGNKTRIVEMTLDQTIDRGVLRTTENGRAGMGRDYKDQDSRDSGNEYFSKTKNWTEAVALARGGWVEGTKRLSDLRDELFNELGALLPEPTPIMDVSGYEVDVGAWVAGEPEHMVTMVNMEGRSRQLRVAVNVCNNAHVSAEAMMMRGLLAAGVVDSLEHLGHRVELDAVSFIKGDRGWNLTHVVHVKRAEEVLDLDRTVFTLAHPSMLRRMLFAIIENEPQYIRDSLGYGYGHAKDTPGDALTPNLIPDLYIGNAEAKTRNMAEVVKRVFDYLREGGVMNDY